MTDIELLKAAAKAAGFNVRMVLVNGDLDIGAEHARWNPLIDDGDALRLAVDLCMSINNYDHSAVICGWSGTQKIPVTGGIGPWHWKEWLSDHADDRAEAVRRAIVRAAAAIGGAA